MALSEIENLQLQTDALSKQLQETQQHLFLLQQQLNLLKGKAVKSESINTATNQQPQILKHKIYSSKNGHSTLENFIGLKIIHLVGIVVLLIGLSIGVKYAIDKDLITPLARILLAYSAGVALFILSLLLKKAYEGFSKT